MEEKRNSEIPDTICKGDIRIMGVLEGRQAITKDLEGEESSWRKNWWRNITREYGHERHFLKTSLQ